MYLSLYCKGSKRVTQGFTVRGSWRLNRIAIYWPPLLWPSELRLSRSPGLLNWRPRGPALCWMWLSLLHLITNWSGPQTPSGVPRAPSAGCGFPYHISYITRLISNSSGVPRPPPTRLSLPHLINNFSGPQLSDFLSWLSYIIVQRPLNRPLNLWYGMFDCHQVEITVMQFRGHSPPVHQSMSVSWDFYLVPFHQPNLPTRSLSITGHWNVSLPSGASLCNGMFARAEGQYITFTRLYSSIQRSYTHANSRVDYFSIWYWSGKCKFRHLS